MYTNETIATQRVAALSQVCLSRKTHYLGGALLFIVVLFPRIYEQAFGWSQGHDSLLPEFQLYWVILLMFAVCEALPLPSAAPPIYGARDRHLEALTPAKGVRCMFTLMQWLLLFALALYFGLSFFTEQTAV